MTRFKWPLQNLKRPSFTRYWLLGLMFAGTLLAILIVNQSSLTRLSEPFVSFAYDLAVQYRQWFRQQQVDNFGVLLLLAFGGGLVASISPCILSLLPVNLSYIGTREITSRRDALAKAGSFVLGVVTVFSLFGLLSGLAAIVLIQFQGYFHITVGLLIIWMGLSLAGVVRLPLPRLPFGSASAGNSLHPVLQGVRSLLTGPYGVGLTFALVSSPCTSPVMFAILTAGSATGSQVQSTLVMVSFALGYTAVIFLASLFTGLVKQTRGLLNYSTTIIRIASLLLMVIGGFYLVDGIRWLFSNTMLQVS